MASSKQFGLQQANIRERALRFEDSSVNKDLEVGMNNTVCFQRQVFVNLGLKLVSGPVSRFVLRSLCVSAQALKRVRPFVTPWTAALQAPPSVEFFRQEYWSGLPCPSPGNIPNPGVAPRSFSLKVGLLLSEPPGKPC